MDLRDQLQATLRDGYTIERELGGGGMSRVFVAALHNAVRAERRYRRAAAEAAAAETVAPAILDSVTLASLDAWLRNQPRRAVTRLDVALAAIPWAATPERDRPYAFVARVYAMAGRPDRARAVLSQMSQMKDTAFLRSQQPVVHEALGEIALIEKRYSDAITEFRRADVGPDGRAVTPDPLSVHFNLGRAFDLANQPDSAIAELEAYMRVRWLSRPEEDLLALAGSHKRLGELYDAKGDRERAISHVSAFIELWNHADPELQPAVSDAKRRLVRLQATGVR